MEWLLYTPAVPSPPPEKKENISCVFLSTVGLGSSTFLQALFCSPQKGRGTDCSASAFVFQRGTDVSASAFVPPRQAEALTAVPLPFREVILFSLKPRVLLQSFTFWQFFVCAPNVAFYLNLGCYAFGERE